MFFKDTISNANITSATPERVYALCKAVEREGSIGREELKEKIEPKYASTGTTSYFNVILSAALDLELIINNDNNFSLAVSKEVLKTTELFRSYINKNVFKLKNGTFYSITATYYNLDDTVFKTIKNVNDVVAIMKNNTKVNITPDEARLWRFWASFLGFGYLDDTLLIPNASVFIKDLTIDSFNKKIPYSLEEFLSRTSPNIDIVMGNGVLTRKLNYGISAGILTLVSAGYISTQTLGDFDVWTLKNIVSNNLITHITVLK